MKPFFKHISVFAIYADGSLIGHVDECNLPVISTLKKVGCELRREE